MRCRRVGRWEGGVDSSMLDLLGYGVLVLEMNLPPVETGGVVEPPSAQPALPVSSGASRKRRPGTATQEATP